MKRAAMAVVTALWMASAAAAQGLEPSSLIPIPVPDGYRIVGTIRLTPETPGDEFLFQHQTWPHVVFVAALNASRSGVGGVVPRPGLCIEPAQFFSLREPSITIADVNGDGRQDVIGIANGAAQVLMGAPLSACR